MTRHLRADVLATTPQRAMACSCRSLAKTMGWAAGVRPEPRREEPFLRGHEAIRARDDHALRRWDDHAELRGAKLGEG